MKKSIDLKSDKNLGYKYLAPSYRNKIQKVFKFLSKKHLILDIGCGRGEYHRFLKNSIGLDKELYDLKKLNSLNYPVILADAEQIPLKDNSIQTVICINTLEYVSDLKITFKEVFRVLNNNGKFVLTVDNFEYPFIFDPINYFRKKIDLNTIRFGAWNWKQTRRFKKDEIETNLKNAGFIIEKTEFISHYLICLVNYLECVFYNFFLSSEYKDGYMLNKKNINFNKKQKNIPTFIVLFLNITSKIICDLDNFLFKNSNGANILVIAKKEK